MKKFLLALLCVPTIYAMELIEEHNNKPAVELIERANVSSADESLKLYTNHKDMFVEDETAAYRIERHGMNKNMRDVLVYKALKKFKEAGYIRINKDEDGKYALVAKVRGEGGGPILAGIFYYGTKAVCYGTALAGATTAVVATGGLAGAVTGAGVTAVGLGASAGTTLVAGGVAGAGLAGEAALATASVVTSSGGIVGAIAAVEAGATFMGAVGLAIPFL